MWNPIKAISNYKEKKKLYKEYKESGYNKRRICIVKLGRQRFDKEVSKLSKIKSKLFSVDVVEIDHLEDAVDGGSTFRTVYSKEMLLNMLKDKRDFINRENPLLPPCDVTIGIIDYSVEGDSYGFCLDENESIYYLSLHQSQKILEDNHLRIRNFCAIAIFRNFLRNLAQKRIVHDESRACLFDKCADGKDIFLSAENPSVCKLCREDLKKQKVDPKIIKMVELEVQPFRKERYHSIRDFIKRNKVLSIIFAIFGLAISIGIGLFTSFLYDIITSCS